MVGIPLHISALFIALVFAIAFLIIIAVYVCNRRLGLPFEDSRRNFTVSLIIVFVWLMFTFIIGISGFLLDFKAMPPRILLVLIPPLVIITMLFLARGFHVTSAPLETFWLIYAQSFRVLVEFIFILLYRYKVLPVQMTYEGGNYDILIGLTAPLVAYYCFNKRAWPAWVALVWNLAGLVSLVHIVTIAMLSTPYPFRYFMNEPANTIIFYFPFIWLPAVLVPFALLLHLMAIRRLAWPTAVISSPSV